MRTYTVNPNPMPAIINATYAGNVKPLTPFPFSSQVAFHSINASDAISSKKKINNWFANDMGSVKSICGKICTARSIDMINGATLNTSIAPYSMRVAYGCHLITPPPCLICKSFCFCKLLDGYFILYIKIGKTYGAIILRNLTCSSDLYIARRLPYDT